MTFHRPAATLKLQLVRCPHTAARPHHEFHYRQNSPCHEMAMPAQLLIIMGFQLAGEALVSACGLSFPGPLCGLLLMLAWLNYAGGPSAELSRAADILVDHLGLLFVPAGAAIIGFGALLFADSVAIVGALLLSTGLAILITGLLGAAEVSQPPPPYPE